MIEAEESALVEQLIMHPAVEALDEVALHGRSWHEGMSGGLVVL
jgi:hypothetical protein